MKHYVTLLLCLLSFTTYAQKATIKNSEPKIINMNITNEFWNELNGPFGGKINDIISPSAGVMLASTDNGLYRSTNSGDSWSRVTMVSDHSFSDLEIDPTSSGKKIFVGSEGGHVYVSTDAGVTWTLLTTNTGTTWSIRKVKVTSTGTTIYLADAMGSLLKSTNSGGSFSTFATFSDAPVIDLDLDELNNVYVSTNGQGIKVSDGTAAFTTPSSGSITGTSTIYSTVVKSSTKIYCLSTNGVHKSVNAGREYALSNTGLPDVFYGGIIDLDAIGNLFMYDHFKQKIYTSTAASAGAAWSLLDSYPILGTNPVLASYFQSSTLFYLGSREIGITKYASGTWSTVSDGIRARNQRECKLFKIKNTLMMTGPNHGYYTSSDNGTTWSHNKSGASGRSLKGFVKLSDNSVLAYGFGAIRLADNSSAWTLQSDQNFNNEIVTSNGINLYSFDISEEIILLSSMDQGVTWATQAIAGLPGAPQKMEVDAENNNYFLVNDEIWKVPTKTFTARKLTSLTAPYIQDFKVVGNSVFVLNEGILYISSDNGTTFDSRNAPASATALWANDEKNLCLGTSINNFYLSNDAGTSWTDQPLMNAQDLATNAYVSDDGFLYVNTTNSVFISKLKLN